MHPQAKEVFSDMMDYVERVNQDNGWYDVDRSFSDEMILLVTEIAEATEAYRDDLWVTQYEHGRAPYKYLTDQMYNDEGVMGKPVGISSELADILVRFLDTCKRLNIDIVEEFYGKMKYNETRGHRHGGKKL